MPQTAHHASRNKKHVVIVEDDKILLKYLASNLQRVPGLKVSTAENGEEGEQLIKDVIPDLVLLDVIMPLKNGFDVLRDVKKNTHTAHVPIVILSNLGQPKDVLQAKKMGAVDYLIKVELEVKDIVDYVVNFFEKQR